MSVTARKSRKTTRYRLRAVAAFSAAVAQPHTNAPAPSATCTFRTQSGRALRSVLSEFESEKDEDGEAADADEDGSDEAEDEAEAADERRRPRSGSDAKAAAIPDGDADADVEWSACEATPSASSGRLTEARNDEADGDAGADTGTAGVTRDEKMRLANERHVRNSSARIMQSTHAEHELNKRS